MKKLIFTALCILGSAWAPEYEIVRALTGESVTKLGFEQVPSLTELQKAFKAINPGLLFEGLIINAHLVVRTVKLSPNNTAELLAHNDEIGLVTHADMIKLPMGITFFTQNVHCEFSFTYLNADSAAQNQAHAQRVYRFWLEHDIPNIMYSLFDGSGRNLLEAMTPYIDKIDFVCEANNTRLTIQYNPSVLNPLNGQRYEPWKILRNIYHHIKHSRSLSSITQDVLDLDNNESPRAWIIAE